MQYYKTIDNLVFKEIAMGESNWTEYKERVLYQLDELQKTTKDISIEIRLLRDDVLMLKVKAGMWGGIVSIGVSAIIGVITILLTK